MVSGITLTFAATDLCVPDSMQLTADELGSNCLAGTSAWMASQSILWKLYTTAVDIWSFGVTVIEMAETKPCIFSVPSVRAMTLIGTKETPHFAKTRGHSKDPR